MFEDFLPLVTKPARYINSEIHSIHKDPATVKTRVCLFFPDTYEVGMSHLGLRILYDILNSRPDTACDRVFSPWTDYEEKLRAAGRQLKSLESNLPLSEFDIIGITLQYELSYTNILAGLDLAHIPLRSSERSEKHPVIIAGGPCALNPEPLSDFIDVFFIGEAEEAVHEFIDLKQKHTGKRQFLEALAQREGFYVPAFGAAAVRRRYLKDIDSAPYPLRPVLPLLKPVHDRITVEVARGCIRGCRFCQAGIIYRPFRERSPEHISHILNESLICTGYEEVSLASLSSGDYSAIEPLIAQLISTYRRRRVSVSLPSLRVGTLTPGMIEAIAGTRKTGFTLAPEAGTERLRRVINKPVTDRDLIDAAEKVFSSGWNVLKLYFMIGLPTETDEDLDGIIRLCNDLLARGKRVSKRHVQINISVSTFVPKPHTPFQWTGQIRIEEIRRKHSYLEKGLRKRGLNLKLHDPETSLIEAAFARGDRSVGRVIEEAVRLGCRFDGWSESFDFQKWVEAFEMCGLDASACASRIYETEDPLPWDHIRSGVTKTFLQEEYRRAAAAQISENCRTECMHCGMGCKNGGTPSLGIAAGHVKTRNEQDMEGGAGPKPSGNQDVLIRIRVKYAKTGKLRFLSHLDFMTLFQRTAARARVPIAFSQGFNPHPRISFGPALSVGIESMAEYLDIETDPFIDLDTVTGRVNDALPEGVTILSSRFIPRNAPSLSGSISRYEYKVDIPESISTAIEQQIRNFLSRNSVIVSSREGPKDIRACIESISVLPSKDAVRLVLEDKNGIKARVQDVVACCFEIAPDRAPLLRIVRTGMFYPKNGSWIDPMSL